MKFDNNDLANYKALKNIILSDSIDLKVNGNAVIGTALLFQWFIKLEDKILKSIDEDKKEPKKDTAKHKKPLTIKEKKPPIKKIGK